MPKLEYCSLVWSQQTVTEIKHHEGVQRRAMKHGTCSLTYKQRLEGIDEIDYTHMYELVTDSYCSRLLRS